MTTNETNGGKGMSRVEIARRALDKAQAHLNECQARYTKAVDAAALAEVRDAGKKERKIAAAKKLLAAEGILDADMGTQETV